MMIMPQTKAIANSYIFENGPCPVCIALKTMVSVIEAKLRYVKIFVARYRPLAAVPRRLFMEARMANIKVSVIPARDAIKKILSRLDILSSFLFIG